MTNATTRPENQNQTTTAQHQNQNQTTAAAGHANKTTPRIVNLTEDTMPIHHGRVRILGT